MALYLVKRILQAVIVLLIVSAIVFLLARLTGDPLSLILPQDAKPEDFENARHELGLDKPLYTQYGIFIFNAITGDFGQSIRTQTSVGELIAQRAPNSLSLSAVSIFFALLIGLPLGVLAAVRRGSFLDGLARVVALLGQVMPSFFLGIVLMLIFSVRLGILPTSGTGSWQHYILPGLTMGWLISAGVVRLLRSSMLEVLDSEYIRLARAKGMKERTVIWKHAFRNAFIPVLTFVGLMFAMIIAAAVVVETVFNWPGLGRLAYEAVMCRDFPVIQASVLIWALITVVTSLVVDILYVLFDPRMRV